MTRLLAVWFVVLGASCGKDTGPRQTSPGNGTNAGSSPSGVAGGTWATVIAAGENTIVYDIVASTRGPLVTFARTPKVPILAGGKDLVPASDAGGIGLVQLAANGSPTSGGVVPTDSPDAPEVAVGDTDILVGVNAPTSNFGTSTEVSHEGAAVFTFSAPDKPSSAISIKGRITAIARTKAGTVWIGGPQWSGGGDCEGKGFIARRDASGIVPVLCADYWMEITLAAAGDDVIACGFSMQGIEIGKVKAEGKTFLARLDAKGEPRWVRSITELGRTICSEIEVAPDGDIVAVGVADENADFTEGAVAKGIKLKPADTGMGVGPDLWLARYSDSGERRFGRTVSTMLPGNAGSIAIDRDSNVLLVAPVRRPLDLGKGPIGPGDKDAVLASIDRAGNVRGILPIVGTSRSSVAADPSGAIFLGVSLDADATVAGQPIAVPNKAAVAIVRVPMPLPAP